MKKNKFQHVFLIIFYIFYIYFKNFLFFSVKSILTAVKKS